MGVSKVYNLMVPALVVTVDKLDLSTESDIEDEEDKVDRGNEMDTDTLSETQVTVSQPSCDQTKVSPISGDCVSESKLCYDHPKSVRCKAKGLQSQGPHSDGQPGHLSLPCSSSSPFVSG